MTATIDGNAAELDDLQATGTTSTQALTITVDDAVTAAQGAAIADATSVATVDLFCGWRERRVCKLGECWRWDCICRHGEG